MAIGDFGVANSIDNTTAHIENAIIRDNVADDVGGGANHWGVTATYLNCEITGNAT